MNNKFIPITFQRIQKYKPEYHQNPMQTLSQIPLELKALILMKMNPLETMVIKPGINYFNKTSLLKKKQIWMTVIDRWFGKDSSELRIIVASVFYCIHKLPGNEGVEDMDGKYKRSLLHLAVKYKLVKKPCVHVSGLCINMRMIVLPREDEVIDFFLERVCDDDEVNEILAKELVIEGSCCFERNRELVYCILGNDVVNELFLEYIVDCDVGECMVYLLCCVSYSLKYGEDLKGVKDAFLEYGQVRMYGEEYLRSACVIKDVQMVHLILQQGVDPSFDSNYLLTASYAHKDMDIFMCLLQDHHTDPSDRDNELLILACSRDDIETIDLLLNDYRFDIAEDSHILFTVCLNENIQALKLLLSNGKIDPSSHDSKCLKSIYETHSDKVLNILLDDGRADPTKLDCEQLFYTSKRYKNILRCLYNDGRARLVNTEKVSLQIFRSKCYSNEYKLLKQIITEINVRQLTHIPEEVYTECLQVACKSGYTKVFKLLLEETNADPTGWESIKCATVHNHPDILRILLQDGRANTNCLDYGCLRDMIVYNRIDILEHLIKDGRVSAKLFRLLCLSRISNDAITHLHNRECKDKTWNRLSAEYSFGQWMPHICDIIL